MPRCSSQDFWQTTEIIRRVAQEPRTTCGELQKDLELAGANALSHHSLYEGLPCKIPFLKRKHINNIYCTMFGEACKILREYNLVRWDQNWRLDAIKHVWKMSVTARQPKNAKPTVKSGVGIIMAWGSFSTYTTGRYSQRSICFRGRK